MTIGLAASRRTWPPTLSFDTPTLGACPCAFGKLSRWRIEPAARRRTTRQPAVLQGTLRYPGQLCMYHAAASGGGLLALEHGAMGRELCVVQAAVSELGVALHPTIRTLVQICAFNLLVGLEETARQAPGTFAWRGYRQILADASETLESVLGEDGRDRVLSRLRTAVQAEQGEAVWQDP